MKKLSNHRNVVFVLTILVLSILFPSAGKAQSKYLHVFNINTTAELQEFFSYTPDLIPFVSAHRGGASIGFPENCIPTFENTLCHTHAILEIDTRLTKDGEIVLMHDATIDRTTTGSGNVSDYSVEELKEFNLRDVKGNPTSYKIPTLDEVFDWADGKTLLILDRKIVPVDALVNKVKEHNAMHRVLFMPYGYDEAKYLHTLLPELVMEVFVKDKIALEKLMETGIPSKNMVAFIAHARPENDEIYSLINDKGMMNIIGTSRIFDHEFKKGNKQVYKNLIEEGCNIIEADLAIDAGLMIKHLRPEKSSKDKFFIKRQY
jgi:glycerophosphoryl diester phosphodiesterase